VVTLKVPRPYQLCFGLFGMSFDALLIHIEHFFGENCIGKLRMKVEIFRVKKLSPLRNRIVESKKCKFVLKKHITLFPFVNGVE
jgi:hypothetical protein